MSRTKDYLKSMLVGVLGIVDGFPTKTTDRSELRALLQDLYPVSGGNELIRLGPKGDGGYLLPDDLDGVEACFSPGVAFESGFERDCAELGMKVFLADGSVEGPAVEHRAFHFTKKFVGALSNAEFMTLDDWVASHLPDRRSDLLLQVDIEGSEYEVFLSATDALMRRFRIIVAEFHQLHQLWSRPFFSVARRALERILQTHVCVHIHPNNTCSPLRKDGLTIPPVMEFTFLRKDRVQAASYQHRFPNPLDSDNVDGPPVILPQCWYEHV